MQWLGGRRSSNFEDRRGLRVGRGAAVGGGGLLVAIVLTLLGAPQSVVRDVLQGAPGATTEGPERQLTAEELQAREFPLTVLGSTEDVWGALFRERGSSYADPKIVFFSDAVESGCGDATAAVGPFYCPPDQKLYLDLTFFHDLDARLGAPGDFAQAYVIAHEVGHHVQTLLGISERVHAQRSRAGGAAGNALSVKMELQADCLAGVWGHHAARAKSEPRLDPGDLEEALRAASSIGDDTLQKRGRGRVAPDSFTHGTSEQRVRWFRTGFDSGRLESCDTFKSDTL